MDQRERVYVGTMTALGLGIVDSTGRITSISTPDKANFTIGAVDDALTKVNRQRADLGAYQNRLELTTRGLFIGYENLQAAESRIRSSGGQDLPSSGTSESEANTSRRRASRSVDRVME